jgi:uncharacterized integral membrane protein
MRVARFLIAYGVVSVLGVLVIVFVAQNTQAERLTFFGRDLSTSLAWIMLAATASGFVFALLLLLPGRIAATLHIWTLRREARELDEELAYQSEQRDDLLIHQARLLSGHEWLLNAYQRTRGELEHSIRELEHSIKEREVLQAQLAEANAALAHLREATARQQPIAPAPTRQIDAVSAPAAPLTQVEHEVPVSTAREEAEDTEDTEDTQAEVEQAAIPMEAPSTLANTSPDDIQQARGVVADREMASDELAQGRSNARSGETPAPGGNWFTSRLARGWQASRSWFRRRSEWGRYRVDQGIIWIRGRGSAMRDSRKSRLGTRAAEHRRVSPDTHPK